MRLIFKNYCKNFTSILVKIYDPVSNGPCKLHQIYQYGKWKWWRFAIFDQGSLPSKFACYQFSDKNNTQLIVSFVLQSYRHEWRFFFSSDFVFQSILIFQIEFNERLCGRVWFESYFFPLYSGSVQCVLRSTKKKKFFSLCFIVYMCAIGMCWLSVSHEF